MVKKLPLTDFHAVRSKLEPHEFAISEGQDVPPSSLIEQEVWDGIIHLPEDVSMRISDHNDIRFKLLYSLWGDWIHAIAIQISQMKSSTACWMRRTPFKAPTSISCTAITA